MSVFSDRSHLGYLSTNLTLSDIAAELFVSRNTVKSQTAAIYRKLDVGTPCEAVDVAREPDISTRSRRSRRSPAQRPAGQSSACAIIVIYVAGTASS